MTRRVFKVYVYDITVNGDTERYESTKQLNYKQTIANYKNAGYEHIYIKLVDTYYWQE